MNDVLKDAGRLDPLAFETFIEHDYAVNPQLSKLPCGVFRSDDDTLTQDSVSPRNDFETCGDQLDGVESTRDGMDAFESAAAAVEFDTFGFDWEEDSAPMTFDGSDFAWESANAPPTGGRVSKKRKLEQAHLLSQRSLGSKYTANRKTMRLVIQGEQDPLARLANWRGVCVDLIAVGYLRSSYPHKGQHSTRFDLERTVPLAWMNSISTSVIRGFLEETLGSDMVPDEVLLNANNFLQTELPMCLSEAGANAKMKRTVFRSEEYKTPEELSRGPFILKGRFVVTDYGRTMLQLPSGSFQPKVPACLVQCIRRSLTIDELRIARGKSATDQKSIVFEHERASPDDGAGANRHDEVIDCLGRRYAPGKLCDYQCETDTDPALTQTRKTLLIHLAAWDEGGAAFAMKQLWGEGEAYDMFRKKIRSLGAQFWKQQEGQMSPNLLSKVRERMDAFKSAPITLSVATGAETRDQPGEMPQRTLSDAVVREAEPATIVQNDGDSQSYDYLEDEGILDQFEETKTTPSIKPGRLPTAQTLNLANAPTVALFDDPGHVDNGLSGYTRPGKFHHDVCFCLSEKNRLSTIFMSFFPCAWPRMLTSIS